MKRLFAALTIAICLAAALHAQKPSDVQPDGVIADPECPYYIIFGIPIPSGECFCLLFGTCG